MKTTWAYKSWGIIYPIGIYYVVSSLVYFALELFFGTANESYMLRQLISSAATIPFIWTFYRQDMSIEETVYGKRRITLRRDAEKAAEKKTARDAAEVSEKKTAHDAEKTAEKRTARDAEGEAENVSFLVAAAEGALSVIAGAALGIGVNNVIAMTPLIEASSGFNEANNAFFAGKVVYELLGSCLLIPIAEELLYRGVVYKRLRLWTGVRPAIILSAVIFGVMHFNLVQFLYAGILGVLLAFLTERTGFLYTAVLAHCAANVAAVVRQETGWLAFSYEPDAAGIGVTLLMLVVAAAAVRCLYRIAKRAEKS